MNSAVGSALIAGILSGVFVIIGVFLGARLQGRNTEQERARAAAARRDEILASLSGAVNTLLAQVQVWHAAAWRKQQIGPLKGSILPRSLSGAPPDPQVMAIEGEIERLCRDVILVVSEIAVLSSRLGFIEPALRPSGERLAVAVNRLIGGIGTSDHELKTRRDDVRRAFLAMDRNRNELADVEPQGRRLERGQLDEGGQEESAGE